MHQKNWMPFVANGQLYLIFTIEPCLFHSVLYHGVMLCLFGQGVPFVRTRLCGGSLVDSDTEFIERHSQFIVLL